ncbi:MAG: OmpP1/FadL family transporter [Desulfobaccales bacterium]
MRSKRWWLAVVAVWGWMVMLPDPALGSSGFSLFEAGARSSALAGAVVARADDLSTIFYNPAGLVQLPGTQVMGGFSTFFPRADIATYGGPSETLTGLETGPTFVPHFFASHQLAERLWLGLGINSPFGLGVKYPDNWPGDVNVIKANIQTVNFNPTAAVKITDYLSAGGGLDVMYFNFDEDRVLPLPYIGPQTLSLDGHSWGLGYNFGLLLKPLDYLSIGISYRSQVRQQISSPAYFQPFNILDANVRSSVILPDEIFTGIMVRPLQKLSLEAGIVYTRWGLLKTFDFRFDNPLGTLSAREDWHDNWRGQFGVEYQALPWLALRAGYALEDEPMPDKYADYLVPTPNLRHNFCFGAGFSYQDINLDLAYYLVYMPDHTVNESQAAGVLPTTYEGRVSHAAVISVSYKF